MFRTGPLFLKNMESVSPIVVNQGGQWSGKTFSILQVLITKAITTRDLVITVTGSSVNNMLKGVYRDMETLVKISPEISLSIVSWNKTNKVITFTSGSIIEFISNVDSQNAKSGKRDYLFVNEANGIEYEKYWELSSRTRIRTFIDYNPTAPFWVHDQLIGREGVELIISDHRHNPFLTAEQHRKVEGISDKRRWWVYARGKTGNVTGLVYPDWKVIKHDDYPWDGDMWGGLDFGYTNDPTAGVVLVRRGKTIYVHEVCYEAGLPAADLIGMFGGYGLQSSGKVYCDHDPEMVRRLRRHKMYAVMALDKRIVEGINRVRDFDIVYTDTSKNLHFERGRYVWDVDAGGNPMNKPIDKNNHLMDAVRYGIFSRYYGDKLLA